MKRISVMKIYKQFLLGAALTILGAAQVQAQSSNLNTTQAESDNARIQAIFDFNQPFSDPLPTLSETQKQAVSQKFMGEISKIIDHQFGKGYLTERAKLNIQIEAGPSVINPDGDVATLSSQQDNLSNNQFYRLGKQCVVDLQFDSDGNSPYIGTDQELKLLSAAKNEVQKRMLREYVALHEHYHCEFSGIQNPVVFGQDLEKNSFMVKGMRDLTPLGSASSYLDTVSENFSDVSAFMSLVKEYGADDPNLRYVLEVIHSQRKDNFLQSDMDVHFTHFSLEKLLQDDTLQKIESISTPEDFKKFAIELSNESAAKTFYEKNKMKKGITNDDLFYTSVMMEVARLAIGDKTQEKGYEPLWQEGNGSNIITQTAQKLLQGVNVDHEKLLNDVGERGSFAAETVMENRDKIQSELNAFRASMKELNSHIETVGKSQQQITPEHKNNSVDNVEKLRSQFLTSTSKLNFHLTHN